MIFEVVKDPIPFLIIDETYTMEEQIQIYSEIDIFVDKLQPPEEAGSAKDKNGNLKKNKGVFLEQVYSNRKFSNILTNNRKLFIEEVREKLFECHYAYRLFDITNSDSTLLSYYDHGGSYFSHSDKSVISMVTWFFKEPKNFTGGGFKFTDYNLNIEVKNNRTVIFFSSYKHEVSEVNIVDKSAIASGRFTLSNFSLINPVINDPQKE